MLSSPDIFLSRLSAHRASLSALSRTAEAIRPLLVVDPAAGEAAYEQHLPE